MLKIFRNFSTQNFGRVVSVHLDDDVSNNHFRSIQLKFSDANKPIKIPLVWLRDHCRSPESYHHQSNQRVLNAANLFELSKIKTYDFDETKQSLRLNWENGHISKFRVEDILNWAIVKKPNSISSRQILWDKASLKTIPILSNNILKFEEFVDNFVKYGVVLIKDIEPTDAATKEVALKIGPIQSTFWGDLFVVSSDEEETKKRDEKLVANKDTSYTNIGLGPHTDGTHFNNTPGIQFLHCIKPARAGGENMLVDGYSVAKKLKTNNPEYFEILANTPVEHRYIEGYDIGENVIESAPFKVHNRAIHPVIKVYNGDVVHIRWEPYERAPYKFINPNTHTNEEDVKTAVKFYEAYEALSKLIHAPENQIQISLQPGTVLFCDNFRVMHARTEFEGSRKVCGGYVSRDDFLAKARPLINEEVYF